MRHIDDRILCEGQSATCRELLFVASMLDILGIGFVMQSLSLKFEISAYYTLSQLCSLWNSHIWKLLSDDFLDILIMRTFDSIKLPIIAVSKSIDKQS